MSASADPQKVSPKVTGAGLGALGVTAALTFLAVVLSQVTPEVVGFLGVLAVPISGGLAAVGALVFGYLRADPLRQDNALKAQFVDGNWEVQPVATDTNTPPNSPAFQAEVDRRFGKNAG